MPGAELVVCGAERKVVVESLFTLQGPFLVPAKHAPCGHICALHLASGATIERATTLAAEPYAPLAHPSAGPAREEAMRRRMWLVVLARVALGRCRYF